MGKKRFQMSRVILQGCPKLVPISTKGNWGAELHLSRNSSYTVSSKSLEKRQLEADPQRSAGVPRYRYPRPLPSSRAKEQSVRGEEGGADVYRILAVSILIVKMSGGCAKGGEGNRMGWHFPQVSLILMFTNSPPKPPTPTPLISPCPLFDMPK